jgi:HTH-type transcriptional regulator/antitoxin HigA
MGTLIQVYQEEHYPIPDETGAGVLRIPMDKHGLTQSNRPEVDSRDVVSKSLRGQTRIRCSPNPLMGTEVWGFKRHV